MIAQTVDDVRRLCGDRVPTIGNRVPAAWWLTTDETQLAAYDQWVADYAAHVEKIRALAESIGLTVDDARLWVGFGQSTLSGFAAPTRMRPGYYPVDQRIPMPDGWRFDPKRDRLVPSRKTKAHRESQANRDFAAIKAVPDVHAYMTGMPSEIMLDDRDFGGTSYGVQYRRGDHCLMAFSGGDPDRQPERRMNDSIDTDVWHRQKLSVLVALSEEE